MATAICQLVLEKFEEPRRMTNDVQITEQVVGCNEGNGENRSDLSVLERRWSQDVCLSVCLSVCLTDFVVQVSRELTINPPA